MLGQVIVGAIGNAPQFAPSKRKQEFKIRGGLAVKSKLCRIMVSQSQFFFFHAKRQQPVTAESSPILEPLQIRARLTEEFQLHLLKFPGTECKVSGSDLISERFPDLADPKRNLLSGSSLDILKVHKNALRRLRS